MTLHRLPLRLALAAALAATGAGLATPALSQDKVIAGGFDVGPGGLKGNFNPLAATAGFTWLSTYYEPLVTYDAALSKIVGALAASHSVSQDMKTYTFKLAAAKWHDGKPFTAADAKFTLELAKNEKSGSIFAARLKPIEGIETPDEQTLVLKLSAPTASILDTLTKLMMLPRHALSGIAVEDMAKNAWWATSPVGTGPYKWSKYVTDQYVELVANPDYRRGKPAADKLINRYFANSATAISALRAGEIAMTYVEPNELAVFKGDNNFRVIQGDSYVLNYIGFNQDSPLFKDVRVRKAFMHAINRDAIIASLYGGAAKAANCVYSAASIVPASIDPYEYNPEKAKKLLAEAGWDKINGYKPVTMLTYYTAPLAANVMAAMQAMLAQVGINIVPRAVDTPTYNGIVYAQPGNVQDFSIVYAGLQNGPDASNVNIGLNEKQIPPAGANIMRIRMPEVTAALDAALGEIDPAKAPGRYQDVCKATNANLPWAPMWVASRYGVVSTKLQDFVWVPAPAGGPYDAGVEKWTIR